MLPSQAKTRCPGAMDCARTPRCINMRLNVLWIQATLSSSDIYNNCLWMGVFSRNWFAVGNKHLDVKANSIFRHCDSLFYSFPLRDASWKCRDGHSIPSFIWIRFQEDSVLVVSHVLIPPSYSSFDNSSTVKPACFKKHFLIG